MLGKTVQWVKSKWLCGAGGGAVGGGGENMLPKLRERTRLQE